MTAALILALLTQDKIKFEIKAEKGSVVTVEATNKSSGKIKVDQSGQVQEREVFSSEDVAFVETVLEAKDGMPVKVERDYKKYKFERKEFADEQKKTGSRSLEGRKIILSYSTERRTRFELPAEVQPEEVNDINFRDDGLRHSLPADAVAPGANWDAAEKDLLADANDQDVGITYEHAKMKFTFDRMEERGGEKCAVLKGNGEFQGKSADGMAFSMKVEVTFWYSPTRKDLIESKSFGSYEMKGHFAGGAHLRRGCGPRPDRVGTAGPFGPGRRQGGAGHAGERPLSRGERAGHDRGRSGAASGGGGRVRPVAGCA
jgi:hypothetical protein